MRKARQILTAKLRDKSRENNHKEGNKIWAILKLISSYEFKLAPKIDSIL
jgi:hypothetical protein